MIEMIRSGGKVIELLVPVGDDGATRIVRRSDPEFAQLVASESLDVSDIGFTPEPRSIHPDDFTALFSVSERAAIVTQARTDVTIEQIVLKLHRVEAVEERSTLLEQCLDYLQGVGILTQARRERIAAFLPPET